MHKTRPRYRRFSALIQLAVFFKPYKTRLILAFIVLIIAAIATLSLPVAIKLIIDQGYLLQQHELINQYFILLIAIVAVMARALLAAFAIFLVFSAMMAIIWLAA